MIARLDVVAHEIVHDCCADGEAITKRFSRGDNVRVAVLGEASMGPELASPAESTLDLIVNENSADLCASLPQREEELRRRDINTTFTLDRLNDDTACRLCHQVVDCIYIVELAVLESRHHWRERRLVFRIWRCAQTSHGPAMKRVVEGDELVLVLVRRERLPHFTRELYRSLVGFGAAVADECSACALEAAGCVRELDELFG